MKGSTEALLLETARRLVLFQDREDQRAQDSEILRSMAGANAGGLLTTGDIKHPVKGIFNRPMVAGTSEKVFGSGG